jgi:hypothetical protein
MANACPRTFCSAAAPYCSSSKSKYRMTAFCSQPGGCTADTPVYIGTQTATGVKCTAGADGVAGTCNTADYQCPDSCTPVVSK